MLQSKEIWTLLGLIASVASSEGDVREYTSTTPLIPEPPPPEAPSEVIVNVNKDEADHTTVVISWVFDAGSSEIRGDRYTIEIAFHENSANWIPILKTEVCCHFLYVHIGQSRKARVRVSAENSIGSSNFTESEDFFLVNFRDSSITLSVLDEVHQKLQVDWDLKCGEEVAKYLLKYRRLTSALWEFQKFLGGDDFHATLDVVPSTEYMIQLLAYDIRNKLISHSEPIYYKSFGDENRNYLVLKEKSPTETFVELRLVKIFDSHNLRFRLHGRSADTPSREEQFSFSRTRNYTIKHKRIEVKYLVNVEFESLDNVSMKGTTGVFAIFREDTEPGPVNRTEITLLQKTNEYAAYRVSWPPSDHHGIIRGYKIRWKLTTSPYNMFVVDQCSNFYDLKVYSYHSTYEVSVSVQSLKGFGPEVQRNFSIGSPPDWIYDPSSRPHIEVQEKEQEEIEEIVLSDDRIEFVPQPRKKIGDAYSMGHARILLVIDFIMVCILLAGIMKYLFFTKSLTESHVRERSSRRRSKTSTISVKPRRK